MKEHSLITGSHGFIGTALQQELQSQGHEVTSLPRKLLWDQEDLSEYLWRHQPDWIFHCGAYGNKYQQTDDYETIFSNIMGTVNLLYASQNIPYKALINVGSSSEYGFKLRPMVETDSLDTDTFYGVTKASATLLCRAFAKKFSKPIVTVRPFSIYGPGDDPDHFIPTAIKCFRTNQELSLSKGVHDWTHVDDLISGMLTVAKNADKLTGGVVNIGTGKQVTNFEVVSILRGILGIPGNVRHVEPLRDYDTTASWVADNSLIKSLGWKPKQSLEEGLERLAIGWK